MYKLSPWEDGKEDALPVHLSWVAWRALWKNMLLPLLQVWHGKDSTSMTAHTLLISSCLGLSVFSSFFSSCGTRVATSCPYWRLGALPARYLMGASSGVIGRHTTHQLLLSTPSAWLHSCLSCLCALLLLTDSPSPLNFISFCGWWLVMKSTCCSFLP